MRLPLGLFITGTDTGVGKTVITTGLIRLLRRQGFRVAARKPLASGAEPFSNELIADDTRFIAEALGTTTELDYRTITPWTFAEPLAPSVAARRLGVRLDLAEIIAKTRATTNDADFLLVEGVGGLLCPITDEATCADLARGLALPILIVVRRSLGTINHTLLTIEAARRRDLPIVGIIINETSPPVSIAEETNPSELARCCSVPILGILEHGELLDGKSSLAGLDWHALLSHNTHPLSKRFEGAA